MLDVLLIDVLILAAAVFGYRALKQLAWALKDRDVPESRFRLLRGIRALIVAGAALTFALGLALQSRTMLIVATVILAEELYETGIALLILKYGRKRERSAHEARRQRSTR